MKPPPNQSYYLPKSDRTLSLGLCVTGGGYARTLPHGSYPPERHPSGYQFDWKHGRVLDDYALVYCSAGSGVLETAASSRQRIRPGQAYVLFPGIWHRYRPDSAVGWEEYWVIFSGNLLQGWRQAGLLSPTRPCLTMTSPDQILPSLQEILEILHNPPSGGDVLLSGLVHALLARAWIPLAKPTTQKQSPDERLRSAIAYLRREITHPPSMPTVARRFNLGYTWFRRNFQKHAGMSPYQYMKALRLRHAQDLLKTSAQSVKEIAETLSYATPYHFMKSFKQETGKTPTQWRRQQVARGMKIISKRSRE
jgi:AraC-like DNA-binding protein